MCSQAVFLSETVRFVKHFVKEVYGRREMGAQRNYNERNLTLARSTCILIFEKKI